MSQPRFVYLIVFSLPDGGIGNCPFELTEEISTMEHIRGIERQLSHEQHTNVVIMNYQLLRVEQA